MIQVSKELLQQVFDALYSENLLVKSWANTALMKALLQPEQPDISMSMFFNRLDYEEDKAAQLGPLKGPYA